MSIKKTMSSQSIDQSTYEEITGNEAVCRESAKGPLCICYGFQFTVYGIPKYANEWISVHVPSLQFFSFCWFGLSYSDV